MNKSFGERYYILHNVQVKKGYPWFVDIWMLIKQEDLRSKNANAPYIMANLDQVSRLSLSNWQE